MCVCACVLTCITCTLAGLSERCPRGASRPVGTEPLLAYTHDAHSTQQAREVRPVRVSPGTSANGQETWGLSVRDRRPPPPKAHDASGFLPLSPTATLPLIYGLSRRILADTFTPGSSHSTISRLAL